jgi:hypothetical protein
MPDLKFLLVTLLCASGACAGVGTLVAWLVLKAINAEEATGGGGPSWDEIKHEALIERQLGRR